MKHARKVKVDGEVWKCMVLGRHYGGKVRFPMADGTYADRKVDSRSLTGAFIKSYIKANRGILKRLASGEEVEE